MSVTIPLTTQLTTQLAALVGDPLVGRMRGAFFFSRHPWVAVVVLAILVLLVVYVQRRQR